MQSSVAFGPFRLDSSGAELRRGKRLIALRPETLAILQYLVERRGQLVEGRELIRAVWPEDRIFERGVRDDSLAQLVRRLREKTEPDPSSPEHIQTVPGRGYRYNRR